MYPINISSATSTISTERVSNTQILFFLIKIVTLILAFQAVNMIKQASVGGSVFCYEFYLHPDFLHICIQSAFVMSHPICIHHQKMTEKNTKKSF